MRKKFLLEVSLSVLVLVGGVLAGNNLSTPLARAALCIDPDCGGGGGGGPTPTAPKVTITSPATYNGDLYVIEGSNVSLSVSVTGTSPSCSWSGYVSGGYSNPLLITNITAASYPSETITCTNALGSDSATVNFKILYLDRSFTSPGSSAYNVPAGVSQIGIVTSGAGGGGGGCADGCLSGGGKGGGNGGNGGLASQIVSVSPGQNLNIYVGQGGGGGAVAQGSNGYGGGGGGGGGGASAVYYPSDGSTFKVIGGGGGGGGGALSGSGDGYGTGGSGGTDGGGGGGGGGNDSRAFPNTGGNGGYGGNGSGGRGGTGRYNNPYFAPGGSGGGFFFTTSSFYNTNGGAGGSSSRDGRGASGGSVASANLTSRHGNPGSSFSSGTLTNFPINISPAAGGSGDLKDVIRGGPYLSGGNGLNGSNGFVYIYTVRPPTFSISPTNNSYDVHDPNYPASSSRDVTATYGQSNVSGSLGNYYGVNLNIPIRSDGTKYFSASVGSNASGPTVNLQANSASASYAQNMAKNGCKESVSVPFNYRISNSQTYTQNYQAYLNYIDCAYLSPAVKNIDINKRNSVSFTLGVSPSESTYKENISSARILYKGDGNAGSKYKYRVGDQVKNLSASVSGTTVTVNAAPGTILSDADWGKYTLEVNYDLVAHSTGKYYNKDIFYGGTATAEVDVTGIQVNTGVNSLSLPVSSSKDFPASHDSFSVINPHFERTYFSGNVKSTSGPYGNPGTVTVTSSDTPGSGQVTVKASATYPDGSTSDSIKTVSVDVTSADKPDLTITDNVTPTSATVGTSTSFSATVRNIGNAGTGASFNNSFQIATDVYGSGSIFVTASTLPPLGGPGSPNTSAKVSASYNFPGFAPGTVYARFCADTDGRSTTNGVISESNENNNCGPWTGINLNPPPATGNITPTGCTIQSGASTCDATLNWKVTNPVPGASTEVVKDRPSPNTPVSNQPSGTNVRDPISFGTTYYSLYHNNVKLDGPKPADASCASGSIWDSAKSLCVPTVNPVCAPTHYNCQAGTSADNSGPNYSGLDTVYNWKCVGTATPGVPIPKAACSETLSMSGTLTPKPTSCTIPAGKSDCSVDLSWNTVNPQGTTEITSPYPKPNTVVATGNSNAGGIGTTVTIPYNSRVFYMYNNGKSLVPSSESPNGSGVTVTASCDTGTSWNGSICIGPMSGAFSVSANTCSIQDGKSTCTVNATWKVTNPESPGNSAVVSDQPNPNTTVYTGDSGSNKPVTIYYNANNLGANKLYLYNNGKSLVPSSESPKGSGITVTGSCGSNSSWDAVSGVCKAYGPQITDFKANPSSVPYNGSSTLTWSTIYADSCTASGDWSGSKAVPSGSESTGNLTSNKTYYLTCTGPGGSDGPKPAPVTVGPAPTFPDLTAGSITPTSATITQPQTFSATISNIGQASTGTGFKVLFQKANDGNGNGAIDILPTSDASTLVAGASETVSTSYTFLTNGTFYMRACADKANASDQYGTIDEGPGHAGENNNCGGWTPIAVNMPASPSATIFLDKSSITVGSSAKLTWYCTNSTNATGENFSNSGDSPGNINPVNTDRTTITVSPSLGRTDYILNCYGLMNQVAPATATLTVTPQGTKKPIYKEQ